MKYTKGEWMATPNDGQVGMIRGNGLYRIADCRQSGLSDEDNNANAHLIAAAPDMREACKGLLNFIKEKYPSDFIVGGPGFTCPHHIAIEKAMAKAEGKDESNTTYHG